MAEQAVDQLVRGAELRASPCETAEQQIVADPLYSGLIPPAFSEVAVKHFCESEWALHLEDVMIRRSSWHYYYKNAADLAQQASHWMASVHHWSDQQRQDELHSYMANQ